MTSSLRPDFARLALREPDFLEQIFFEINPILVRILAANGIHQEAAEDIIHETWERFFTNLEKFEGRSQLRTFICGILIHKIQEARRAQKRHIFEEDSEKIFSMAFNNAGWWNRPADSPEDKVYSEELSEMIEECLEGLTALQKSAFFFKEILEEESETICNDLGISVSHLRVLIFRAKDKLKLCLSGKL